ncbi:MAG: adenylate/guanylate cyclase domain-containing protein [Chryseolinea sp.]
MELKRGTYLKFKQLRFIIASWVALGFIIAVYDHLVLHTQNSLGTSVNYSFAISAARNMGAGLMGALLGGSLLVFYVNVKYRDRPYGQTILYVSLFFVLTVAAVTAVMAILMVPVRTGKPLHDPVTLAALKDFVTDSHPLKSLVIWSLIVAVTQLMLQVNNKFGQGVLADIVTGKYQMPKAEKRVFMFLDLNGSTSMAEQLGDERYHQLLRDFFADITNPILDNHGNIYQYVGDEVVVSWEYEQGIKGATCIQCFFDIKQHIHDRMGKYVSRYGFVPTFKAGIHCGTVVAGEIGIIKRDITYSGDVLNTTSRIQSLCKEFDHEIIASGDVISEMGSSDIFSSHFLGAIKLRGKEKELPLNGIRRNISVA